MSWLESLFILELNIHFSIEMLILGYFKQSMYDKSVAIWLSKEFWVSFRLFLSF